MGNIYTYLKWRGDLDFTERPFCEVDNLVLSQLSYVDFSGIVPTVQEGGNISLEAAALKLSARENDTASHQDEKESILARMARTNRFCHVKLSRYVDVLDEETQIQFAALHIELGDGTTYIAFRGTDDRLVGWREDFSMSFQLMPSQKSAAEYLRQTIIDPGMRYRVGGHSKGGNLAVYAAMQCPAGKQGQIIEVYSNDGPGICSSIVDIQLYQNIAPKLIRIVPEFCVIGALFEQEKPTKIVGSSADGFAQHDLLTWQVEGDHLCEKANLSAKCMFYNEIFDTWLESASMEQRKAFTNDFFDALGAGGAKRVSELTGSGIGEIETILTALTTQSERKTKIVFGKFLASAFHAFRNIDYKQLLRSGSAIRGTIFLLIGLFFMIAPEFATKSIGVGLGLAALFWLGKRLLSNAFSEEADIRRKKYKLIFYMGAMCLVSFLIAKSDLMLRFTNLLVGASFLITAVRQFRKGTAPDIHTIRRVLIMALGIILFILGVIPIVFLGMEFAPYAGVAGICFFLYGMIRLVYSMYENGMQATSK